MIILPAICGQPMLTRHPSGRPNQQLPPVKSRAIHTSITFEPVDDGSNRPHYISRNAGFTVILSPSGASVVRSKTKQSFEIELIGARISDSQPQPEDQEPGVSNYFLGSDPSKWRRNVPHWRKVRYAGVYPGIDIIYYGGRNGLEYDFIVQPGADAGQIHLKYKGEGRLRRESDGSLVMKGGGGELRQHTPSIYQSTDTGSRGVAGGYHLADGNVVTFLVGAYDRTHTLTIDPVLQYATYFGGSNNDWGERIAVDSTGAVYVTGITNSIDFQHTSRHLAGGYDSFVTKFNATGTAVLYSTYVGGSADDYGRSVAVDATGNCYVSGYTLSTDFPVQNAFQPKFGGGTKDAFFFKLSPDGSTLLFSSYLGGSGDESSSRLALDGTGAIYITGDTTSTDFPTKGAMQANNGGGDDGFLVKVGPSGSSLVYSTYIGGNSTDLGGDVAVDSQGNAYVVGTTYSDNFPIKNAFQPIRSGSFDVFIIKLDSTGSTIVYSTYLGGSDEDQGWAIAVDQAGSATVTGLAKSKNFPVYKAFQSTFQGGDGDAFITKLTSSGSGVVFSTYLGGSGLDWAYDMTTDVKGSIFISGYSDSLNFPTANATQWNFGGYADAFVAKVDSSGSRLLFSTYFGGSGFDVGSGLAADSKGNVYLTGVAQESFTFPKSATPPVYSYAGGLEDAFVAKLANADLALGLSSFAASNGPTPRALTVGSRGHNMTPESIGGMSGTITMTATITNQNGSQSTDGADNVRCSASAPVQPSSCTLGSGTSCLGPGNTVLFPGGVGLNPGQSLGLTITYNTTNILPPGSPFNVQVACNSDTNDPDPSNNSITFAGATASIVSFDTAPSGLVLNINGTPITTPQANYYVDGTTTNSFAAPTPQLDQLGHGYVFQYWADNGAVATSANPWNNGNVRSFHKYLAVFSPCTYLLNPTNANSRQSGGTNSFTVNTQPGCAWTAVSSDTSWLTIPLANASGTGTGPVNYSTSSNASVQQRQASISVQGQIFTVTQAGSMSGRAAKVAAYNAGYWVQDLNGNFNWDGPSVDRLTYWSLGRTGEVPVYGDWNGDGKTKIGLYVDGTWLLDYNGNGVWDGPNVDKLVYFGGPGFAPYVGDWNGSGTSKIGVHQNGTWLLDYNGNFAWDGPGTDKLIYFGGPGYTPVLGDWNGSGTTKIGVHQNGTWLLDYNGNFSWDGPGTDKLIFFGGPGYTPVVGDWNGLGTTKIGAHKDGLWLLDYNGNFSWDGPGTDKLIFFGGVGYTPVVGDWNGGGTTKVGAYLNGQWVLDINGNFMWDPPIDQVVFFGGPGQIPIVGKW